MRFQEKLQRFMMGRNGVDELSKLLNWISLGVLFLGLLTNIGMRFVPDFPGKPIIIFGIFGLALLLIIFQYWRIFSKNLILQRKMNAWYINLKYNRQQKKEQGKIYKFFKCPKCAQKVRVPKGRGRICITCPKCKNEFIKVS